MKPRIPTRFSHPLLLAPRFAGVAAALLLALTACAPAPKAPDPSAPSVPTVTEAQLRERAVQNLALGQRQYEAGTFDDALKSLNEALTHGVLSREDQAQARKLLAFVHCVSNREDACRSEFRKALEINSRFDLTPAEAGHPIWGPIYRNVRAQLASAATPAPAPKALSKSEQLLADGMAKYDAGEFDAAHKILQNALKEGLDKPADQLKAIKHSAFCLCLAEKWGQCRTEFMKLFDVDPNFDLTPAEAGHPSWTRTYAGAKQRWKDAQAAKDKQPAKAAPATK
ncbi:MAG: TssQ family T6SS-associated lipoprotein [Betaproteobacteria bacterium]|nr:TssQ family T6SS-associated lipoprotein [Betaproteobacteria bacterium]